MSKSAINSLLKRRTHLNAAIKTLDDKRKPLSAELEGIDGARGHAESTDVAVDVAAATPTEPPEDHSAQQNEPSDKDAAAHQQFVAGMRRPTSLA